MKLLGWMHRKLRHTKPFKDFGRHGLPSLDDQQFYPRHYGTKFHFLVLNKSLIKSQTRLFLSSFMAFLLSVLSVLIQQLKTPLLAFLYRTLLRTTLKLLKTN